MDKVAGAAMTVRLISFQKAVFAFVVLLTAFVLPAAANDYIKAADIMLERGFSAKVIFALSPYKWRENKEFSAYLAKKVGVPVSELDLVVWKGLAGMDLRFDTETGVPFNEDDPINFARSISDCYRRDQPWNDCKIKYHQIFGCYFSDQHRDVCAQAHPGHTFKPRYNKRGTFFSCWKWPEGDLPMLPKKEIKSLINLAHARRTDAGRNQLPAGNDLDRPICTDDPDFFQTERRRYIGPIVVPAGNTDTRGQPPWLSYCAPDIKLTGVEDGKTLDGRKFCAREMAAWFCARHSYGDVESFSKAKGLGRTEFHFQTICKKNCDGFEEITCSKPDYQIVGKYSEDTSALFSLENRELPELFDGFRLTENSDVVGGKLSGAKGIALGECINRCKATSGCAAFSYDKWNKWCFLKTSAAQLRLEPKSLSGVVDKLTTPARSSAKITMTRYRGKIFPYQGYRSFTASSFESCEADCLKEDRCVAFSFQKTKSECRLMNSALEYFSYAGVDSGAKRQVDN